MKVWIGLHWRTNYQYMQQNHTSKVGSFCTFWSPREHIYMVLYQKFKSALFILKVYVSLKYINVYLFNEDIYTQWRLWTLLNDDSI